MIFDAPAKLNLCLYLGPCRPDGLHELVSIFCPLSLGDRLAVTDADADEVVCPGVAAPNLAATALAALRDRGWDRPPMRIEISKRIPVAAGLGGGSADAAAVLRLAGGEVDDLEAVAAGLGADVTSQLDPSPCLVSGAGEIVEPIRAPAAVEVVGIPSEEGLATADVYGEADRLGLGRPAAELAELRGRLSEAAASGAPPLSYAELLRNDLEAAALSLQPGIEERLAALRTAGAEVALVAGSGPTAVGLFSDRAAAERAARELVERYAGAFAAHLREAPA